MATVPRKKKQKNSSSIPSTKSISGISVPPSCKPSGLLNTDNKKLKKDKKDKKKRKDGDSSKPEPDLKTKKLVKTEKSGKLEKYGKSDKPGKSEKLGNSDKPEKTEKFDSQKASKQEKPIKEPVISNNLATSDDGYQTVEWQVPVICYFSWVFKDLFVTKDLSIQELTSCIQVQKVDQTSTSVHLSSTALHTFVYDLLSGIFGLNTRLTCPKRAHKLLNELYVNQWDNHEYELQSIKCTQLDRATIMRARRRFFGIVPPILIDSKSTHNTISSSNSSISPKSSILDSSSFSSLISSIDPDSNKNLFYQLTNSLQAHEKLKILDRLCQWRLQCADLEKPQVSSTNENAESVSSKQSASMHVEGCEIYLFKIIYFDLICEISPI